MLISVGTTTKDPTATRIEHDAWNPNLATDCWWSPHLWANNRRKAAEWVQAGCVVVDVDHEPNGEHTPRTPEATAALEACAMPGSRWHLTPRGARVVFDLSYPCTDREQYKRYAAEACARVAAAVPAPYVVDAKCSADLARLFYAPRCTVKGEVRDEEWIHLDPQPLRYQSATYSEAADAYRRDNVEDWSAYAGTCPMCGHHDCFKPLDEAPGRWFCFSANHGNVGKENGQGHMGDVLDYHAHAHGMTPTQWLVDQGYLELTTKPQPAPPQTYSQTYLHLCRMLADQDNQRLLCGGVLGFDDMSRMRTVDQEPIEDELYDKVRARIEHNFMGPPNKDGECKPLRFGRQDVITALNMVAKENRYNPVQRWLETLQWDGECRLPGLPLEVLDVPAHARKLAGIQLRCWFIGLVARALRPGIKMDNMLILKGEQRMFKSAFFNVIGGKWFCDTHIDLRSKDAYLQMGGNWIVEWQELATMHRSKDANAIKAFLSAREDTFRQPYGMNQTKVPRRCVVVGTTNDTSFLGDSTGNRRFWVVPVVQCDMELLSQYRELLLAEAVHAFKAEEQHWLTQEQEVMNDQNNILYSQSDPWCSVILQYLEGKTKTAVRELLDSAIRKPREQWSRADDIRIAEILRQAGWKNHHTSAGNVWRLSNGTTVPSRESTDCDSDQDGPSSMECATSAMPN